MATSPEALARAARALASGDPLSALGLVGDVASPAGRLLKGIAYAQLGDEALARTSLERVVASATDALTRARARAALVELALSTGSPGRAARAARASVAELDALGDVQNASMQRLVLARAEVLLGRLAEAARLVDEVLAQRLGPFVASVAALARAEIALRALAPSAARAALSQARQALASAPNHVLARALVAIEEELARPVARLLRSDAPARAVDLFAIEEASGGAAILVDTCRRLVIGNLAAVSLARRPVLLALLLLLARAWPASVPRDTLAGIAFGAKRVNPSHHARLRVELGRLRRALAAVDAAPRATPDGYALASAREVLVLLPLSDDEGDRIALLLADGASWSAQALAEHAGTSKRTVQRALAALVATGAAIRVGKGKEQRYAQPGSPIASRTLLLGLLPRS